MQVSLQGGAGRILPILHDAHAELLPRKAHSCPRYPQTRMAAPALPRRISYVAPCSLSDYETHQRLRLERYDVT